MDHPGSAHDDLAIMHSYLQYDTSKERFKIKMESTSKIVVKRKEKNACGSLSIFILPPEGVGNYDEEDAITEATICHLSTIQDVFVNQICGQDISTK